MRQLMSRLFGIVFGILLYPLRSLILNLGILIAVPFVVITLQISILLKKQEPLTRLLILVSSPLFVPFLFALGEVITLASLFIDLALSARFAVKTAMESGISGVFSRLATHLRDSSCWLILIGPARRAGADQEQHTAQPVWTNSWQAYDPAQFQDVPKSDLAVNTLPSPEPRDGFTRLTEDECLLAKGNTKPDYKKLYDRYMELQEIIDRLDRAIEAGKDEEGYLVDVDDQIFKIDIQTPCLLFKQVNLNGQWQVTLATTCLIDKGSYNEHRRKSDRHPLYRENLDNPLNEEGVERTARYCLVEYQGYCAELHELADRLRDGFPKPELSTRQNRQSFLAAAGALTLFGQSPQPTSSSEGDNLLPSLR